jgi:hypothetical protein
MMLTSIKSVVIKAFEPYLIHSFKGHSGSDIGPLTSKLIVQVEKPDSQRYFDYHHAK